MKVGDLVRDLEYGIILLGIILYKVPPNKWDNRDKWFVKWFDGDSYALPESEMETICK